MLYSMHLHFWLAVKSDTSLKMTKKLYHGTRDRLFHTKKTHFKVSYPDTDVICDFTLSELKDDFNSSDLWFT